MNTTLKLYDGLKALSDAAFPKQCPVCGRRYETLDAYIRGIEASRRAEDDPKSGPDDEGQPNVELYRNCPCGARLLDCFDDRRDLSQPGLKRRRLFGQLLEVLDRKGVEPHIARVELIRLMRGEKSKALSDMGVKTKTL